MKRGNIVLGTFDQKFIHHTLGVLPSSLMQQVDGCLKTALGIP